jgi:anti-anti-sigma factor
MSPLDDFTVQPQRRDASLEVVLAGELDMAAAFQLETTVEPLLDSGDADSLVLDLAEVRFIDSAGIGALLSIRERAQGRGLEFAIGQASDPVRRMLELTGVSDVLGA